LESKIIFNVFGAIKSKGLNRIAKISNGLLCRREENLTSHDLELGK
jgi:hypothetical protein